VFRFQVWWFLTPDTCVFIPTPHSFLTLISEPVFAEVDDILILRQISAGYFKRFVHVLHDVPMITLYNHKRFRWYFFNLLQCAIFFNILDMLPILCEMIVGKIICYQLVNLRLQSVSIF
jgi:hypothetical protein